MTIQLAALNLLVDLVLCVFVAMPTGEMPLCQASLPETTARQLTDTTGTPSESDWRSAPAVAFCADWRGQHSDQSRATEVRLLWAPDMLFVRFAGRYRELYMYPQSNTLVNKLWERDVAEMFIQPPGDGARRYKEFEISPNGNWIDLDIGSGTGSDLHCPLKAHASIDEPRKTWVGELTIPMRCLTAHFDPHSTWRVNFFRVEGREPNRFYSAWHATKTPQPNFHVPEVFGTLRFK